MAGAKTYARNASERPKAGAPPVKDDQDVLGAANAFRTFFSVDAEIDLAHSTRSAHSSSRVPIDADVHWLSAVSGTLDSGSRLSSSMGQIFHGRREKQRGLALCPPNKQIVLYWDTNPHTHRAPTLFHNRRDSDRQTVLDWDTNPHTRL